MSGPEKLFLKKLFAKSGPSNVCEKWTVTSIKMIHNLYTRKH